MRQIPGYEDYMVDEDGNVYSCKWGKIKKLKPAINRDGGYLVVRLSKNGKEKNFYVHRLIYSVLIDNILSDKVIDHIDRNQLNNKIDNLRAVSKSENQWNNNAKGYGLNKKRNKFQVKIGLNKKQIHIGYFNTEEEARAAYLKAKETYHVFDKNDINEESK